MKRVIWISVGIVAAVLVFLWARPRPLQVQLAAVATAPMEVTVDEEGRSRIRERFVVSSPVTGRLDRIDLREGDMVSRGAVVARIAPAPLDARAQEQAVARLASVEAARQAALAANQRALAAAAQSRRDRQRAEDLASQGMLSPETLEQARLAETARAHELEMAQFAAQAAARDADAARAALTGADPEHPCPDVVLVRAPVRGRVLRIPERSERVVAPGTPLLEIGDPSTLEIVAEILSADAVKVKHGDPVRIEDWGGDGPLAGRVRVVEPSGFTKISALGVEEQRVRVIVDPADDATGMGDGFRAEVRIVIWARERTLQVPTSALFRRDTTWSVFTVEDDRARERPVSIGHRNAQQAEVLSGLTDGDSVILHPADELHDGRRVL